MHPHRLIPHAGTFTAAALAFTLAACGGAGDDPVTPPPATASAQGLWIGTTATNRTVTGLVLSDGSFLVLYSAINNTAVIDGVLQGNGTVSANVFSSNNARDFNFQGTPQVLAANLNVTVATKQTFNGNINYGGIGGVNFTTTYDARYETVPTLAALAGAYTGQTASMAGVQNTVVNIATTGAITSNSNGCTITGTATPRVDANAYNVSLVFGPAPCVFASQTLSGVAYFDSTTKRLYSVTPNAARTDGVLFAGTKP